MRLGRIMRRQSEALTIIKWRLTKPEYLFRPLTILRRFRKLHKGQDPMYSVAKLYWRLTLRVSTSDKLSAGIIRTGIDDITQSEIIWRLLAGGDTAIDVGANIGYVASIMAAKVGPRGKVLAFEPHPGLCEELRKNVNAWGPGHPQVEVFQTALSEQSGVGSLSVPQRFHENRGVSRVVSSSQHIGTETLLPIALRRLDDVWEGEGPIALVKIDVEGHELAVLKGARRLFKRGVIRNIVFEDFGGSDSETMRLLKNAGYTIWQFGCDLLGPRLSAPGARKQAPWLPPNFLASLTPGVVEERLRPRGWRILRPETPCR